MKDSRQTKQIPNQWAYKVKMLEKQSEIDTDLIKDQQQLILGFPFFFVLLFLDMRSVSRISF